MPNQGSHGLSRLSSSVMEVARSLKAIAEAIKEVSRALKTMPLERKDE